ncbi:MAG: hypothetical protein EAZ58_13630 [Flavobacterium sp.]|nr:MAG: hypothetical protein EAZ58_13630 [Flavobacterium sp.]
MSGYSNNFMNLYYDNPEKISLYWTAKATKLRLEDFYTGASPNQPAVVVKNKSKSNSNYSKNISTDLIKTLHQSKATIKLIAKELSYKKFKSKNIIANIRIANDSIKVDRASMIFAKGTVQATGTITHQKKSSPFAIQLKMQNVDLQKTLYTFDNFESTTITDKNTRGTVSVTANLKGQLTQNAQIVKNSINGFTIVAIKNGALINFKPIKLVGKYVFPFRDFNNVSFAPLYIDMTINNSLVKIKPTAINSSVINMDFAGVYGFRGNTNMQLDVHLRDPQKDKGNTNKKEVQQNRKKGITLHLQAIEDKGEMKIKLRSRNEKLQ